MRDILGSDVPAPAAPPGDANPDLARPVTPGPLPIPSAGGHAGPSEEGAAAREERQNLEAGDDDRGQAPADASSDR